VKNGRLLLVSASEQASGHSTTGNARFYAKEVGEFLQSAPRRAM
jgi:homoserine O-acetyltransferase/O-succinyltransferase